MGDDFNEAFLRSIISTGFKIPQTSILLSTGNPKEKAELIEELKYLQDRGMKFYGTKGTADFYKASGINVEILNRPFDKMEPAIVSHISDGKIDLVINIPKTTDKEELDSDYIIRRSAVDQNVPLITNTQIAKRFFIALQNCDIFHSPVKSWNEYN